MTSDTPSAADPRETSTPSLLDRWMPEWDVAASYHRDLPDSPERVWRALQDLRAGDIAIARWLMSLRRLSARRPLPGSLLEGMTREGFVVLEKRELSEIVIGVAGKFWLPSSGIVRGLAPDSWRSFRQEGFAASAMNFRIQPAAHGARLTTETRILAFGSAARFRFRCYWTLVGPFSGLIRVAMLREIARRAASQ